MPTPAGGETIEESTGDDRRTRGLGRGSAPWATDGTTLREVPDGWRDLVARLLDDVADVMVDWPEATIEVRELRAECGGLAADLSITAPASGAAMATGAVEVLVEKARRASELTCSICGGPGSVRSAQRRYAALCDSHFGGWVARHGDRDVETGRGWRETADREVPRIGDGRPTSGDAELGHRLYDPADVRAALGLRGRDVGCLGPTLERPDDLTGLEIETNHQNYLHTLLDGGEAGCLRTLAHPDLASLGALDGLEARAPHMAEVTEIVRRHVRAALAIGLPTSLPALMLLGGPGTGKSWFLSRLASVLAIPHRRHPMNGQSLADGLSGSHPTWRNAQPGLVARCLLAERIANPLVLIDEVDKAGGHHVEDPYRALYDLLEPEGARTFVDEYLQFPIDASRVLWVLAGNDIEPIPAAILDRLTIIAVPTPDEGHLRAVAASVYEECNAVRRSFFPAAMGEDVLERLLGTNPRGMRKAIAEAMTRAAADGRGALRADDVVVTLQPRRAIGFR